MTKVIELNEEQAAKIDGLRKMTNHLEANPDLLDMLGSQTFYLFHRTDDVKEFARKALLLGDSKKSDVGDYFNVTRSFGPISLQVTARHEFVCEKVVVDSTEVEVEEMDQELATAALADIPRHKVTKVIERTEWRCPVLLEVAQS